MGNETQSNMTVVWLLKAPNLNRELTNGANTKKPTTIRAVNVANQSAGGGR